MKKNERGVLSVEASIVLCMLTLFVLFLFNFVLVYRAENMVSHATLQSADAVALESYLRETTFETDEERVLFWANRINGSTEIPEESFESLRSVDLPTLAKEKFLLAIDDDPKEADSKLKKLGVKDGIDGIDFSESYVELTTNDVIVKASYTVNMKFPVFGASELKVTKAAKAKTAGEILFDINVVPDNEIHGVTTGTGRYKMGTEVEITATPNYGYDFTGWNDGVTDNPRIVTVTDAHTYIANFERYNFGITLFTADVRDPENKTKGISDFGSVIASLNGVDSVGGNEYPYESTVSIRTATNPGYEFFGWEGTMENDSGVHKVSFKDTEFKVEVDSVYVLTALYKPIEYNVSVTTSCDAARGIIGVSQANTGNYYKSVSLEYGNYIQLKANEISGYTFKGWYKGDSKVADYNYPIFKMPVGGGVYEARYEKDPIITVYASGKGNAVIVDNNGNTYCCKKGSVVTIAASPGSGYYFAGWSDGGNARHSVTVTQDVTYTAIFKPYYSVTVTKTGSGSVSGGGNTIKSGETTGISASPATGYHFVRWEYSTDGGTSYYYYSSSQNVDPSVNCNTVYRAVFEKNTYTVKLDTNGGSLTSASSYSVAHGDSTNA